MGAGGRTLGDPWVELRNRWGEEDGGTLGDIGGFESSVEVGRDGEGGKLGDLSCRVQV